MPARSLSYYAALEGERIEARDGFVEQTVEGHGALLLLSGAEAAETDEPVRLPCVQVQKEAEAQLLGVAVPDKPVEEMDVPELQALILQKLASNGPLTDRMRREVAENTHRGSLLNWARSFR